MQIRQKIILNSLNTSKESGHCKVGAVENKNENIRKKNLVSNFRLADLCIRISNKGRSFLQGILT